MEAPHKKQKTVQEIHTGSMEALPVELVGVILSRVDELTLPCCYSVTHSWTRALQGLVRPGAQTAMAITTGEENCQRAAAAPPLVVGKNVEYCWRLAREGRLAVLQWARANDCPWDERTCAGAARGGHLGMLQWARANGCPWDERTCSEAAFGGHLEALQWARAKGCPWNEQTWLNAEIHGHTEVVQWACANGCPVQPGL
jgi:hypothetical protein